MPTKPKQNLWRRGQTDIKIWRVNFFSIFKQYPDTIFGIKLALHCIAGNNTTLLDLISIACNSLVCT